VENAPLFEEGLITGIDAALSLAGVFDWFACCRATFVLDGVPFDRSEPGKSRPASSFVDAWALYEYDPGSLLYGV
jgi:hypothetical protein